MPRKNTLNATVKATAKTKQAPLAAAIGAVFITSLATAPIASADSNPFAAQQLSSGYMVADAKEGNCGANKANKEGNCGADKAKAAMKTKEGNCGGDKAKDAMKTKEGNCGADKAAGAMKTKEGNCGADKARKEGNCGADKAKKTEKIIEAKCGEAKCGANK